MPSFSQGWNEFDKGGIRYLSKEKKPSKLFYLHVGILTIAGVSEGLEVKSRILNCV